MLITDDQIQQYRTEGYFILESVIPDATLEALRNECQRFIDERDREMEAKGVTSMGITHYKKRYFISNQWRRSPAIIEFLFSDLMAAIGRATLGDNVYLFNEQYVVKAAEVGTQFAWHQDSGYIGHYHRPYLSCWCALDDMTVENGTAYALAYADAGMTREDLSDSVVEE